jgi:hypothetical protein
MQEEREMAATMNEATLATIGLAPEVEESAESLRLVQNSLLTELPGMAIGFITLFYLVSSLIALV